MGTFPAQINTYLPPELQFLLLLSLCDFFLCKFLARDFALVESCEVFFARRGVEVDFLGGGDGDFPLFGGRRHCDGGLLV